MMSLSPSLKHDIQLMEALVVEELEAEANPKQEHDLLVKIVYETMLQPRQEVLCSTVDREKTPPALPIYIWPPSYASWSPTLKPNIHPIPYAHLGLS